MIEPDRARELARIGRQARRGIAQRNAAIIEAVAAGGGIREVAGIVGVNHATVLYILKQADPERRPGP